MGRRDCTYDNVQGILSPRASAHDVNDIAIYAIHTNLDNILENGVNERIAKRLNLQELEILKPIDSTNPEIGAGIVGYLKDKQATESFLTEVKTIMKAACLKHTKLTKSYVYKIGVCGGSGSFLLADAIAKECDVFITSDFKYHQFFDANDQIIIADIGHYETEQFTIDLLVEIINKKFSNFAAQYSKVNTNPVQYI